MYLTFSLPQRGGDPTVPGSTSAQDSPTSKRTRASQACETCQQMKTKCDEMKPCKTCKRKNVECQYRSLVSKATDKPQTEILDRLTSIQSALSAIMNQINHFDQRLLEMENMLSKTVSLEQLKPELVAEDEYKRPNLPNPGGF